MYGFQLSIYVWRQTMQIGTSKYLHVYKRLSRRQMQEAQYSWKHGQIVSPV